MKRSSSHDTHRDAAIREKRPSGQDLLTLTRRHFFRECGVGVGKIALAALLTDALTARARADEASPSLTPGYPRGGWTEGRTPLSPRPPHHAARAKRVIHL